MPQDLVRPAIFLDRDGVIIRNRADYVKAWDEVVLLPGALSALRHLSATGYAIVIVTNQSPINRGITTETAVGDLHRRLVARIEAAGGRIDGIFYCPHTPEEACRCRKPEPGLLLEAAEALGLDVKSSWLVGDARTDIQAALNAGCRPIFVLTGRGDEQLPALSAEERAACIVLRDLRKAVHWILSTGTPGVSEFMKKGAE